MPFVNLHAITTKVYDLLRTDVRTSGINWFNSRRARVQSYPAGNVYLGGGEIEPRAMPRGEHARVTVVAEIAYASEQGIERAEALMRTGLDDVIAVLVDNWDLGLSYAFPERLEWETTINPEAQPQYAAAEARLDVRVIF